MHLVADDLNGLRVWRERSGRGIILEPPSLHTLLWRKESDQVEAEN